MVTKLFPNVIEFASDFPQAIIDTLLMLVISGLISVVIGILLAVIVVVTRKDGLKENQPVFWILDKIINLFRSIPFIILIPTVAVLSRALFGTTIGIEGALVPLVIGTAPFVARQMESAIMEIDPGIIEASIAMGLSTKEIIFDVYLRENIPGMIRGLTISFIALVGQIAIVGSVGAGGLGDMAIRYGLQRSMGDITFVVIILILILISIVQAIGDKLVEKQHINLYTLEENIMNKNILKVFTAGLLAFSLAGCGSKSDSKTITVGATTSPHAIILKHVQPEFEKAGYTLKIKEFSDYPNINPSTSDGSLDANFFQHQPYLTSYNKDKGYKKGDDGYLVSVGAIHFEPLGLYSTKYKAVSDIKDGAKIAIPNDATNEARALLLLADNGVLTLKKDAGVTATKKDVVSYNKKVELVEVDAAQVASKLPDVDFGIINGNYALDAKVTDKIITSEDSNSEAAKTYQNIIAVKESNKNNKAVKKLVEILKSDSTKKWIEKKFGVSVKPAE